MQTLTINGNNYAVTFSYSVIVTFCEKQGIELYEYGDQMAKVNFNRMSNAAVRTISLLIHCAIVRGCEMTKQPCDLSPNDITDALFSEEGLLASAITAIQNDMPVKKKETAQEMTG